MVNGEAMQLIHSRHKKNHRNLVDKFIGVNIRTIKRKFKNKDEIIENIISKTNIAEDVLNGAEIISLIGRRNIVIENYEKVIEYGDEKIIIKTKKNYVIIEGKQLKIEYLLDVEVNISGIIDNIKINIKYPY